MTNRQGVHGGQSYVTNWQLLVDLLGGTPLEVTLAPGELIGTTNAIDLIPNSSGTHHVVTISSVAVSLPAFHANTTHIAWRLELASVRVTVDGVTVPVTGTPGVGVGIELKPNDSGVWSVETANAASLIRNTTTDAILQMWEMMRP